MEVCYSLNRNHPRSITGQPETPVQSVFSKVEGPIQIFPLNIPKISYIDGFSHRIRESEKLSSGNGHPY